MSSRLRLAAMFVVLLSTIPAKVCEGQPPRASSVRRPARLRDAFEKPNGVIRVFYISDGESVELTSLGAGRNSRMYALFRATRPIREGPSTREHDVEFEFTLQRHWTQSVFLDYSTETGQVRLGKEYAYVPTAFRKWLRDLYVKTPKQRFRHVREGSRIVNDPIFPPPMGPTVTVGSQPARVHYYDVVPREGPAVFMDQMPGSTFEVAYVIRTVGQQGFTKASHMSFLGKEQVRMHRFPPSYAGKTIHYRFRWKYKDGTYTQWSKTVSAKVLP